MFHELLECRFVMIYYCLPDFLLYCTYIDKTSDTCGTAVKFSKDEGIFVSLATNSCRTRNMGMYGFPAQRVGTRTRHTNPNSFRHIQTSKDCYKYTYFPRSITLWNQLPTTFTTADTVDGFKSMIPVSALIPIFTP